MAKDPSLPYSSKPPVQKPTPIGSPTSVSFGPDEAGEWVTFASEPVDSQGNIVNMGPVGHYTVTLYAGSTSPPIHSTNAFPKPPPSLLQLPGEIGSVVGHARDGGSPINVVFKTDTQGRLDTIEVEVVIHHIDPLLIRSHPLVDPANPSIIRHDMGEQVAAEEEAYRRAVIALNWYSFAKRIPININSVTSRNLATGHEHTAIRLPFMPTSIQISEFFEGAMNDEFARAFGLYREALCTENPFYRFITLFKIWELIDGTDNYEGLRARLSKDLRAAGQSPSRPTESFTDGDFNGRKYKDVLDRELRETRDTIAHAILDTGFAHRPDDLADIRRVRVHGALLHQAVREILTHECEAFNRLKAAQVPADQSQPLA